MDSRCQHELFVSQRSGINEHHDNVGAMFRNQLEYLFPGRATPWVDLYDLAADS